MGIKISRNRVVNQAKGDVRADLIRTMNRPLKGENEDILSFNFYFKGFTLLEGEDGPELFNSRVYISVYHFLEYEGLNPHDYNTIDIGGYLTSICNSDFKECLYKEFDFYLHKYEYNFILKNMLEFEKYKNF